MTTWRIFYDDYSTFSDEEGLLEVSPRWGVICGVTYAPDQQVTTFGMDFYTWDAVDGQFQARDRVGVVDYAMALGLVSTVTPGAPSLYETSDGMFDLEGLLFWLIDHKKLVWAGRTVPASQYHEILNSAQEREYLK